MSEESSSSIIIIALAVFVSSFHRKTRGKLITRAVKAKVRADNVGFPSGGNSLWS